MFIFSYNDPDSIDRILLDRIHRIKFDHLSVEDKLVIANDYLLPEIYKNVGLSNIIEHNDSSKWFDLNNFVCFLCKISFIWKILVNE